MATVYDVAKLAGVSHTAASAVLNDRNIRIGATTRQRIFDAARELDYRPNRAAQQLAMGKFNSIALCFERADRQVFFNPTANSLIAGVGNAASEHDMFLVFAPTNPGKKLVETIKNLPLHGVDGAVVIGPIPLASSAIDAVNSCSIPLVCIDSYPGFTRASTVDKDNPMGMAKGVEHLIANGHQRMVYLGPPPEIQCYLDRMLAFYETVQSNGLSMSEQVTRIVGVSDVPVLVQEIADSNPKPTAVVCGVARYAVAVWDAARAIGLHMPDDLAILTFDDLPSNHPAAEAINVIRNIPYEMGKAAAELLIKNIDDGSTEPSTIRLMPKFVFRPCPPQP